MEIASHGKCLPLSAYRQAHKAVKLFFHAKENPMIDILVAVNGEQLAQQVKDRSLNPGTQSSPTNLGSYQSSNVYISMTAQNNVVVNDGGGSELTVAANSGDTLRWSMQTFDGNADYTAYLYAGTFNPPANITPLTYLPVTTSSYLPTGSNPLAAPSLVHNSAYFAQGTVLKPGTQIQYFLSFTLVNSSTGAIVGYFSWDPFISLSQ
jgi:nematocidal protein AidA